MCIKRKPRQLLDHLPFLLRLFPAALKTRLTRREGVT